MAISAIHCSKRSQNVVDPLMNNIQDTSAKSPTGIPHFRQQNVNLVFGKQKSMQPPPLHGFSVDSTEHKKKSLYCASRCFFGEKKGMVPFQLSVWPSLELFI